jgi:hypothetical protein
MEVTKVEDYPRIQARIGNEIAGWLDGRAEQMHTGSRHQQAAVELGLWRSALYTELGRIRLTLGQANCIADVLNGSAMNPVIGSRPGLVYAECYDAFAIAREAPIPDLSSYGAKWGPEGCDPAKWEQDLLDYLGKLNAVADHALMDAIAKWWDMPEPDWEDHEPTEDEARELEITRFGYVRLEVTADKARP